jgi:Tfp pilus assembly protein PilV
MAAADSLPSSPSMPRRRHQQGFTLLEVLVAMLLTFVGLMGMLQIHGRAIGVAIDATERNQAALMAGELTALMWANNSATLDATVLDTWKTTRLQNEDISGLREAELTVSDPDTNGVVLITISWTSVTHQGQASRYVTEMVIPQELS